MTHSPLQEIFYLSMCYKYSAQATPSAKSSTMDVLLVQNLMY